MAKTKIEWADDVLNPIVGCSKISAGCKNCYAEKMARRLKAMGNPKYQTVIGENGKWTGKTAFDPSCFGKTLRRWPKRIFLGSMCDIFHETVKDEWLDEIFSWCRNSVHTWIWLTKRPERALEWERKRKRYWTDNIWFGVTAENQGMADQRIPLLLKFPAKVRFVSIEPCLESVDLKNYLHCGLSWCIVGAESGHHKRFFTPEWAERMIKQCEETKTPVFYKQDSLKKMPEINGKNYAQFPSSTNSQSE